MNILIINEDINAAESIKSIAMDIFCKANIVTVDKYYNILPSCYKLQPNLIICDVIITNDKIDNNGVLDIIYKCEMVLHNKHNAENIIKIILTANNNTCNLKHIKVSKKMNIVAILKLPLMKNDIIKALSGL